MGAIWFEELGLVMAVSEIVGYKSGLALSEGEYLEHLSDEEELFDSWRDNLSGSVRIRAENFEHLILHLLQKVGYSRFPIPSYLPPSAVLYQKFSGAPEAVELIYGIQDIWMKQVKLHIANNPRDTNFDPKQMILLSTEKYGSEGQLMAMRFLEILIAQQDTNPWTEYRRVEWDDEKELKELFVGEGLETLYGHFVDQRFVDYLAENFHKTDMVNWRKFEGLAGEHFSREGYYVEMGPGRNDDGVDLRVWSDESNKFQPPTILVQCRRRKNKVEKAVVKALWADVLHERAKGGLVVTTTTLSPGAQKTIVARGYSIDKADRETLRRWLEEMRTPGRGVLLV